MGIVLRLTDKFNLKGHGWVYLFKDETYPSHFRLNDVLYDLFGHRFQIKGIEMIRLLLLNVEPKDRPIGLTFTNLDGVELKGCILTDEPCIPNILFCNHPLSPTDVNEDYEQEYNACEGLHKALYSYEDLVDKKLSLYGEKISGVTIYRGWMLKPEQYRFLYGQLKEHGIILINSPEEYEKYHLFPGWYKDYHADTAESVWMEGTYDVEGLLLKAHDLGKSAVVKDYVKSRKHEWYEACFIENLRDTKMAEKVIRTFIDRQGEDLVGGVVLRRFMKLKSIGYHEISGIPISEEYRVFIYAGTILEVDDYWNSVRNLSLSEEDIEWIRSRIHMIRSPFVTMDLARKRDGYLMIVELDDGQVSGLQNIDPTQFYGSLLGASSRSMELP